MAPGGKHVWPPATVAEVVDQVERPLCGVQRRGEPAAPPEAAKVWTSGAGSAHDQVAENTMWYLQLPVVPPGPALRRRKVRRRRPRR